MGQSDQKPSGWFWRRLMAYAMTAFSMTSLTWLMWNGLQDGRLHLLLAEGHLWILIAIFVTYVLGATIPDLITLVGSWRGVAKAPEKK